MSGDTAIVLVAEHPGALPNQVRALRALPHELPRWALVGGLAVVVRLARSHRGTVDIDTVSIDQDRAAAVLLEHGATPAEGALSVAPGVKLDLIDVSVGDPDDGSYLAHRWALDCAEVIDITVVAPGGDRLAEATVPVATPAALVAMKAHALKSRRAARPEKMATDTGDIVALVTRYGASAITKDLESAGGALASLTASELRRWFIDDEARTRHRINVWSATPQLEDAFAGIAALVELLPRQ